MLRPMLITSLVKKKYDSPAQSKDWSKWLKKAHELSKRKVLNDDVAVYFPRRYLIFFRILRLRTNVLNQIS